MPTSEVPDDVLDSSAEWWRSAVVYQVYPRSFADADGDGIGDLPGITDRLSYLRDLGVDAVWISPFYRSPLADGGYDVIDYREVEPVFGTVQDAETLIETAHKLGIRVMFDLVPNHTSDEHPWFQAALAAGPGSPERARYWFRDSAELPNNWQSDFGGPAWDRAPDGQWFLHLFDSKQPDLNWDNPEVHELLLGVLRFWLDRGVDGFRIDVAHGLVKADGLPDMDGSWEDVVSLAVPTNTAPFYDQDGVHEIYRTWRQVLDSYDHQPAMVAEAWVAPAERLARYVRPDECHQAFNFAFLATQWNAPALRECIAESVRSASAVGAPTTWVFSNHDVVRAATRLGFTNSRETSWLLADEPPADLAAGLRRARAAAVLMLALPGCTYLYQGEELGLFEVVDLPPDARRDPTFRRTEGATLGRDGCRVPMPWSKNAPAFGFNTTGEAWLPQPAAYGDLAVDQQAGVRESTLELYRALLRVRRARGLGAGEVVELELGEDLLGYEIRSDAVSTQVVVNFGDADWRIPADAHVLVASKQTVTDRLARDHGVWLAR
ncbi:glycoside hydrolase family 13 protein [Kribbella sp. NPDC050124]|uniref:glycoside hydrolase family 13 protein n=1 Tax=Kribbella sp. NPDC050124 TaxID=3364114 RepID=UPI0037925FCD